MRNRSSLTGGLILIFFGIIFLLNQVIDNAWPFLIIGLGAAFLVSGFVFRNSGMMIPGAINVTLGAILLYQATTQDWASWFYLWPIVPTGMGVGMLLSQMFAVGGQRYLRVGLAWTLVGLATTVFFWFYHPLLTWPAILIGLGSMFLLVALLSGVMPQAIPGVIIGGIGLLLAWQNATGQWASWAYTWALIPAFVGLGLFISFLRNRTVRTVGLWMMGWSLVVFLIFGLVFGGNGDYLRFWPLALIMIGLMILVQSFIKKPQIEHE